MSGRSPRRRLARLLPLSLLLLSSACVTRTVEPNGSVAAVAPQLSVERFLQAVTVKDLESMARLFGTADGPVADRGSWLGCAFKRIGSWFGGTACRRREDIEIQMDVLADILRHDDYRFVGEERVPGTQHPTTRLLVDLAYQGRSARGVPFDVVRSPEGRWLVQVVGVEEAMDRR